MARAAALVLSALCAAAALHGAAAQYSWTNLQTCKQVQDAAEQVLAQMTDAFNNRRGWNRKYTITLACGGTFNDCAPKNRTASNALLFFSGTGRLFMSAPGCSSPPTLRSAATDGARFLHLSGFKVRAKITGIAFDGDGRRPGILLDTCGKTELTSVTVQNMLAVKCPVPRPYPRKTEGNSTGNITATATACGAGLLSLSSNAIMKACTFTNNVARFPDDGDGWGGGVYIDASTKYPPGFDNGLPWLGRILTATACRFEGGQATVAGGVFIYKSTKFGTSMKFRQCVFNTNSGIGSALASVRNDNNVGLFGNEVGGIRLTLLMGNGLANGPKFNGNTGPSLMAGFRPPPIALSAATRIAPKTIFYTDRRPVTPDRKSVV